MREKLSKAERAPRKCRRCRIYFVPGKNMHHGDGILHYCPECWQIKRSEAGLKLSERRKFISVKKQK